MLADPWYDYLPFPTAPFVLFLQAGFLFVERRWLRWLLMLACAGAIAAMREYIIRIPLQPEEGACIGCGLMEFWFTGSLLLLGVAVAREVVEAVIRLRRG